MAIYVKNKDLLRALKESKEQDELTRETLDMLILMSNEFSKKFSYNHKEDREDCVAFAIFDCYRYWRGFNPEKSDNPFAYFSQVIKNGFAKQWRVLHRIPQSRFTSLSKNNLLSW